MDDGVQGARGPNAAEPARRAVQGGRPDVERARAAAADDALRRHEAPAAARGGRPRDDKEARSREAALPEPRPDPARPRPMGEQVRRALGRRPQRAQAPIGGQDDGEGVRDLHQDDPRATLGGDHRQRHEAQVQLRRRGRVGLDAGLAVRGASIRRGRSRSSKARTSRSTRRAGSYRASAHSGATT